MAAPQNFVTVTRRPPDVEDYIDMLRRYRSWLIGPMFAGLVIAVVVAFLWPDTYVSTAVMRITPQQISDRLVPTVVNMQMQQRLQQMQQEILSRGSLIELIQRPSLDLYRKERQRYPMEDIVQDMRNWAAAGIAADARTKAVSKTRMYYLTGATALAVAVFPNFNFTMRPMISVQAKNRSRGRLMVNSAPLSVFTAVPIASRHGLACGFRL